MPKPIKRRVNAYVCIGENNSISIGYNFAQKVFQARIFFSRETAKEMGNRTHTKVVPCEITYTLPISN